VNEKPADGLWSGHWPKKEDVTPIALLILTALAKGWKKTRLDAWFFIQIYYSRKK